jgi:hypothetical protein
VKLTVKATASLKLPPGKKDCIAWDDDVPGFGIRLREGGARNWVYQYKLGKQQRRITFGSVTAMSIADARRQAEQFHAQVKLGRDPAGDKVDAKIKAAETFEATAARYLEYKRTRLRPRSYSQVERHVLKHAKALHGLQLAKIERRDIATAIAAVADDAGMVTGNRVRATLSAMFTWALMHGLAETNPVIGTMRNKERSRERVLTPAELRLLEPSRRRPRPLRCDHQAARTDRLPRQRDRRHAVERAARRYARAAVGAHEECSRPHRAAQRARARHHRSTGAARER